MLITEKHMNVHIHDSIQQQYPKFRLALVPAKGLMNTNKMPSFEGDLRRVQEEIRKTWTMEKIDTDQHFQLWREAYKVFGAKPKKHMCSVENMYRSIISGREIPSIHPLVDGYNIVSLEYGLPVGADDTAYIDGDVFLEPANGSEHFMPLNSKDVQHPKEGEIIYRDEKKVLCRRWNWRECEQTKITDKTRNAVIYIENLLPSNRAVMDSAAAKMQTYIRQLTA